MPAWPKGTLTIAAVALLALVMALATSMKKWNARRFFPLSGLTRSLIAALTWSSSPLPEQKAPGAQTVSAHEQRVVIFGGILCSASHGCAVGSVAQRS